MTLAPYPIRAWRVSLQRSYERRRRVGGDSFVECWVEFEDVGHSVAARSATEALRLAIKRFGHSVAVEPAA